MPTVKIGTTSKRINSTSQTFVSSTSLSCKLKDPCSMQSPVFEVQGLSKGTLYNFAQFENRYYWVDDVVYLTNDIQEVHCHLDVLATFKSAIGNTSAFVKYSNKTNRSRRIDDPRIMPEIQPVYSAPTTTGQNAFHDDVVLDITNGTIIMRVMNYVDGGGFKPGVITYAMRAEDLPYCLADLSGAFESVITGTTWGTTLDQVANELSNVIAQFLGIIGGTGSWRDNLLSLVYVPVNISTFASHGSSTPDVCISNLVCDLSNLTGHNAYIIDSSGVYLNCSRVLDIPWWNGTHQGTTISPPPFMRNPRWCALQVQLPGTYLNVDTTDLVDQTQLGYFSCINIATGNWSCKVTEQPSGDQSEILASTSGCIGLNMMGLAGTGMSGQTVIANAIGKMASVGLGVVGSAMSSEATSLEKSASKETDKKAAHKLNSKAARMEFNSTATGIAGNILGTGVQPGCAAGTIEGAGTEMFLVLPVGSTAIGKVILRTIQFIPKCYLRYEDWCDEYGYPCNDWLTLSNNAGYTCCVGASVSGATGASESNKSTINSYLNSGFYYE